MIKNLHNKKNRSYNLLEQYVFIFLLHYNVRMPPFI